ncbi:MAG: hypothetical protein CMI24_09230 [Opitutae bacterium]|nr:hypothetical protein [Opitutae bacterium]
MSFVANWIISLNGEAFHQSRMSKFITLNESSPRLESKMQGLKNAFCVELIDIRGIHAYFTF